MHKNFKNFFVWRIYWGPIWFFNEKSKKFINKFRPFILIKIIGNTGYIIPISTNKNNPYYLKLGVLKKLSFITNYFTTINLSQIKHEESKQYLLKNKKSEIIDFVQKNIFDKVFKDIFDNFD